MALIVALIVTTLLCTSLLLRGQYRLRRALEKADATPADQQTRVAATPDAPTSPDTISRPTRPPRPILRPATMPVIFDPVPIERQVTR